MKKILFFGLKNLSTQNLSTQLEIMSNHIEKGDEVYVLRCNSFLPKCYSNFYKLKSVCFRCRLNFDSGMNLLNLPKKNIFTIKDKANYCDFPKEFKNQNELLRFAALGGVKFGFGVVSNLISELKNSQLDTIKYKVEIEKSLKSSILIYESVYELLQFLKPNIFYVWNGRFFDVWPAIEACKKLNVEFYTYENTPSMYKYSIFKNRLPHDLQAIKKEIETSWSESILEKSEKERRAKQFFINKRNKSDLYSWVKEQNEQELPKNFDITKTNIAIFNSSLNEYEAFDEYKIPIYLDENDAVNKIIEEFKDRKDTVFYLRVHPQLRGLDNYQIRKLKDIEALKFEHFKIIWPEEKVDSYALLDSCDKVVSFHSTIGVEACFWGKPSILIGKAFYEDLGCCYIPKNHSEVLKYINSTLTPLPLIGPLKYGHWMSSIGTPYKKYQPLTISTGNFMGKGLWSCVSLKNKLKLKSLVLQDFGFKNLLVNKLKKIIKGKTK